jgi:hypothetical protein
MYKEIILEEIDKVVLQEIATLSGWWWKRQYKKMLDQEVDEIELPPGAEELTPNEERALQKDTAGGSMTSKEKNDAEIAKIKTQVADAVSGESDSGDTPPPLTTTKTRKVSSLEMTPETATKLRKALGAELKKRIIGLEQGILDKIEREFNARYDKDGWKSALAWRDRRFGDEGQKIIKLSDKVDSGKKAYAKFSPMFMTDVAFERFLKKAGVRVGPRKGLTENKKYKININIKK